MTEHCGHNFCHACISNFIAGQETWNCPECRSEQTTQADGLVRNRLVEKAVKQFHASQDPNQSKALCPYHGLELSICMSIRHCPTMIVELFKLILKESIFQTACSIKTSNA